MRRPREHRLFVVALGLVMALTGPGTAFAHAMAHLQVDHHATHVGALDAHDVAPELASPDHPSSSHQHARLDLARRTPVLELAFSVAVTVTPTDWSATSREHTIAFPVRVVVAPEPRSEDPPRLRAPPTG